MPGNTRLIDYGIQNDKSDIRAHVAVIARRVYIFDTKDGARAAAMCDAIGSAKQSGIKTGVGKKVPPDSIRGCISVLIPDDLFGHAKFDERDSTGVKGSKAIFVVKEMLKRGLIPVSVMPQEITDKDLQIQGADILITARANVQVKCDYRAGHKEYGGTGNLFLQIAECNPFGIH